MFTKPIKGRHSDSRCLAAFSFFMTHGDSPAFASAVESWHQKGLSKREYFAAIALQGLLAGRHPLEEYASLQQNAQRATELADMLIGYLNVPIDPSKQKMSDDFIKSLLTDIGDYMDNKADTVDTDYGPAPNKEMAFAHMIDEALKQLQNRTEA